MTILYYGFVGFILCAIFLSIVRYAVTNPTEFLKGIGAIAIYYFIIYKFLLDGD